MRLWFACTQLIWFVNCFTIKTWPLVGVIFRGHVDIGYTEISIVTPDILP